MTALVQLFVDIVGILFTFVNTYMVPATVADVTIIHVAIWTPVIIGLITLTVGFVKRLWARGRR